MNASQHQNLEKVQSNSELINSTLEGYQLTDIGILPEDWELKPLGDLTTLMTNGFVGTAKTHYTDSHDGVIYIQGYNVEENSFNFHGIKRVTAEFNKRHAKSNLRAGDLLMVQTGDVGLVTVVPPELAGSNCHALIISRFKTGLESKFFAYYINSQQGRNRLKELETGTTMKHINVGDLLYFQVPVPLKVEEQTAIANALSDVDALIQELEKLIAKKQAIKTATMQQLLTGRTRLPQFAHHPDGRNKGYKPSELGEIPEDWEVEKFNNLTTLITCGIAATPTYVSESEGYPFLSSTNVKNGKVVWKNYKHISKSLHTQLYKNNPPKVGDVLYSRVGTIGEAAVIEDEFEFSVYVSLTLIKPKSDSLDSYFLMQLLNSEPYKDRAKEQVYLGGGVGNLNVEVVRNYPIIFPQSNEQKAIAKILSDMDLEINSLEQRLGKTRQIKQGMMQELLTGKTRLVKAAGAA